MSADERWQPGALIRCASARLYRVVSPEGVWYVNYGRWGGRLGGGLFVRALGSTEISWLSPASVTAATMLIAGPSVEDDAMRLQV